MNAGKSSLFNRLLGRERALVHPEPGTTRDVVEAPTRLGGLAVTLLDTAGERATDDPVEAAGLALARELVDEADLLVVVLRARAHGGPDPTEAHILARTAGRPRVVVLNGIDREGVGRPSPGWIGTSAATGEGVEALERALVHRLVHTEGADGGMIASARQRDLLVATAGWIDEAAEALELAGIAVAADALTRALEEMDALTGADTREDVLDALFARFCIGK